MNRRALWRRVGMVAIAGLLVAGAVACGKSDSGGESAPIKIGASIPLTGQFSQEGKAAKQGYEVWAAMVNEKGGLLGRKVDLLIGTYSSLLNLPASAVAEKNKMLYVEPAGGAPEIFERGMKYLFFSQQATADKQGEAFAKWISTLPEADRPKTAAYPTIDDPFVTPNVEGIRKVLEGAGIQTVLAETYQSDLNNFDTIVSKVRSANPDLVVHGAFFDDGVGFVRSMLKADFKPRWLYQTTAPSLGDEYAKAIGPENTEGIIFAISHAPQAQTPGNAEFVKKYGEMFGGLPAEDAADAYGAAQVLQAAVEKVGNIDDQAAMADWLRANTVPTILGDLSWDDAGRPQGEFLTGQWQDGKVEYILPKEFATTDHIVMGWEPGKV